MTGETLKRIIAAEGMTITEMARRLGYAGDQALHSVLRSPDVKSGVIERMAVILGKDVAYIYKKAAEVDTTAEQRQRAAIERRLKEIEEEAERLGMKLPIAGKL